MSGRTQDRELSPEMKALVGRVREVPREVLERVVVEMSGISWGCGSRFALELLANELKSHGRLEAQREWERTRKVADRARAALERAWNRFMATDRDDNNDYDGIARALRGYRAAERKRNAACEQEKAARHALDDAWKRA